MEDLIRIPVLRRCVANSLSLLGGTGMQTGAELKLQSDCPSVQSPLDYLLLPLQSAYTIIKILDL